MWTLWNYKYDMVFPQYCLLYRGITLFVFTFSSFVVVLKCIKRREDITAFWTFLFSLLLTNRSTCNAVKIKKKKFEIDYMCVTISGQTRALQLESIPLTTEIWLAPVTETTSGIYYILSLFFPIFCLVSIISLIFCTASVL